MLILTRKPGESIRIGDDIVIYVKSISGKTVRLGITAPQSIPVYREELLERAEGKPYKKRDKTNAEESQPQHSNNQKQPETNEIP